MYRLIFCPTDLNLLNDAREKLEELIVILYDPSLHSSKPRTYREVARKTYLHTAQKKSAGHKVIRKAIREQLNYVRRDIKSTHQLLGVYKGLPFPLKHAEQKYLFVVQTLYDQQKQKYDTKTPSVDYRIVNIHQPHVRPIVRGKVQAKVEFGAKIHVSIIDGISFLDELSWDATNERSQMIDYVEKFRKRFGCYPCEVLVDQIYYTRSNRSALKELGIKLLAKPLGRYSAMSIHVSPGERNPIEGKFGQAKTAYGLDCIKARLKVKLAGVVLLYPFIKYWLIFSARLLKNTFQNPWNISNQLFSFSKIGYSRQVLYIKVD